MVRSPYVKLSNLGSVVKLPRTVLNTNLKSTARMTRREVGSNLMKLDLDLEVVLRLSNTNIVIPKSEIFTMVEVWLSCKLCHLCLELIFSGRELTAGGIDTFANSHQKRKEKYKKKQSSHFYILYKI